MLTAARLQELWADVNTQPSAHVQQRARKAVHNHDTSSKNTGMAGHNNSLTEMLGQQAFTNGFISRNTPAATAEQELPGGPASTLHSKVGPSLK